MPEESFNETRLQRLVEAAPDGVLLHAGGEVVYANPAAARLLGAAAADDLVGRPIAAFAAPGSRTIAADLSALELDTPGEGAELVEDRMARLDGEVIEVEVVALPSSFRGAPVTQLVVRDVTPRKRAEAALKESERRYRDLFEGVPVGVYEISRSGELKVWNRAVEELLAAPGGEGLEGLDTGSLYVDPEDRDAWKTLVQYQGRVSHFETRIRRLDGARIWVRCQARALRDADGKVVGYEATVEDVTDRRRAEDALRASEERFRSLVQNAADLITILDREARVVYHSPASQRLLGFAPSERVGTPGFELVHPRDRPRIEALFAELLENPRRSRRIEVRMRHADGSWRMHEAKITNLLQNPAVDGVVVNSRDVTDRRQAEARLRHDALHDALTGLPNRTLFMDRLEHCLNRRSRDAHYRCAVLFLDLDRFKMVNDSLGHAAGDRLLVQAGRRLKGCLRPNDSLARLGGDEFAVLLDDVGDASVAVKVARRIRRELETPFELEGREVYSSASIGIAVSGDAGPEEVLRDADTAMYRAKSRGRAAHAIFDERMHGQVRAQLQLETDLRQALELGQLEVFYQPIVTLPAGALAGFEALVRWRHPERGLLLPGEFMPLAEETGLVDAVGGQVLEEACRQMKAWNDLRAPREPLLISVNLSNRQFRRPGLCAQLGRVLEASGLAGDRLAVEVDEAAVAGETEVVLETLVKIKQLGVRLSLDNFGSGTGSLSLLHRLPFDHIKIDRWFVLHAGTEAGSDELLEGILTLCRGRRLATVAEGVETAGQRRKLVELGCGFAQGFLFSEPVDRRRAETLLEAAPLDFD